MHVLLFIWLVRFCRCVLHRQIVVHDTCMLYIHIYIYIYICMFLKIETVVRKKNCE